MEPQGDPEGDRPSAQRLTAPLRDKAVRLVENGDGPRMQFDVVDTGIGMSDEQAARVFQPFAQADADIADF
jgi:signal transduction histidine kinase